MSNTVERTNQSAPLAVLCDSVRASTTRYGLLRRILLGLSGRLQPHYQKELHSVVDDLDSDHASIEAALAAYCEKEGAQ